MRRHSGLEGATPVRLVAVDGNPNQPASAHLASSANEVSNLSIPAGKHSGDPLNGALKALVSGRVERVHQEGKTPPHPIGIRQGSDLDLMASNLRARLAESNQEERKEQRFMELKGRLVNLIIIRIEKGTTFPAHQPGLPKPPDRTGENMLDKLRAEIEGCDTLDALKTLFQSNPQYKQVLGDIFINIIINHI